MAAMSANFHASRDTTFTVRPTVFRRGNEDDGEPYGNFRLSLGLYGDKGEITIFADSVQLREIAVAAAKLADEVDWATAEWDGATLQKRIEAAERIWTGTLDRALGLRAKDLLATLRAAQDALRDAPLASGAPAATVGQV